MYVIFSLNTLVNLEIFFSKCDNRTVSLYWDGPMIDRDHMIADCENFLIGSFRSKPLANTFTNSESRD